MARLFQHEPLYRAFSVFLQQCWLGDSSFLWPDQQIWTLSTLDTMRRRFVEVFLEGSLTFREKLESQLNGAPWEVWALAADCFYIYGLGTSSVRFPTKMSLVAWCAGKAGLALPPENDPLWEALKDGVASTGQKYHLKHAQLRLMVMAGLEVKASPQRAELISSPLRLQTLLDGILEAIPVKLDRAHDMRNAILYLAFPEEYEPILSNRDKDAILEYYQGKLKIPLKPDRDAALHQVRLALDPRFRERNEPFTFFGDLRGEWRTPALLERNLAAHHENLVAEKSLRETGGSYQPAAFNPDPDLARVLEALKHSPNVILSGPPGVGKTYLADQAAQALVSRQAGDPVDSISWIAFHPSYSYEDFVEGLRPVLVANGQLAYDVKPGIFLEIVHQAVLNPSRQYVLVIDEINRGNLARILGELVTLLEQDKRGRLSMTLPYSGKVLSVPPNLALIGTMNSADRSIAPMDVALRRRFAFVELEPRPDLLAGITVETEEASLALDELLNRLNHAIRVVLDRDHQLGHSYFLPLAQVESEDRLELLEFIWNHQVLPLLEEYFAARPERLTELLAPLVEEGQGWEHIQRIYGEDLVVALSRIGVI